MHRMFAYDTRCSVLGKRTLLRDYPVKPLACVPDMQIRSVSSQSASEMVVMLCSVMRY